MGAKVKKMALQTGTSLSRKPCSDLVRIIFFPDQPITIYQSGPFSSSSGRHPESGRTILYYFLPLAAYAFLQAGPFF
jgi:hypothetical protein